MTYLNPEPRHQPYGSSRAGAVRCLSCDQHWPCSTERLARVQAGLVPPWTPNDVLNLRRRVRRMQP